jgi:hypothetical protein
MAACDCCVVLYLGGGSVALAAAAPILYLLLLLLQNDGFGARKRHLGAILYIKCIILPRQARDKHGENSKTMPFSQVGQTSSSTTCWRTASANPATTVRQASPRPLRAPFSSPAAQIHHNRLHRSTRVPAVRTD